jgi:hypothetical protein
MPTKKKAPQATARAGDVADQMERTHAAVTTAITAGYADVEAAMKQAEIAVAQAVSGVAQALRLAQQEAKKPRR